LEIIGTGIIQNLHTNSLDNYSIIKGMDYAFIYKFESEWKNITNSILDIIINDAKGDNTKIKEGLDNNLIQDGGWNWFNKISFCNSDDYKWFYLTINNNVEACCIIYHPKNSKIDSKNISYIDYLAVAPWNRDTIIGKRKYASLGIKLLSTCCNHIKLSYSYRDGFSLHSLPQALPFYLKLGMKDFGIDVSKENLNYLEMEEVKTKIMVEKYA
jgi:hypothetical protein